VAESLLILLVGLLLCVLGLGLLCLVFTFIFRLSTRFRQSRFAWRGLKEADRKLLERREIERERRRDEMDGYLDVDRLYGDPFG
jgi:hypothetical protein